MPRRPRSAIAALLARGRKRLVAWLRPRFKRLGRAVVRELARQARKPVVQWVAVIGVGALVSLNLAVRAQGGDVHPLSVRRVPERIAALGFLLTHRLHCDDGEISPEDLVRAAAWRYGVSPRLALAVARTESGLVHTRISSTGAMGLMQLMPGTAHELGVRDPFDPRENVDGGVRYLAQLTTMYRGDTRRAVAAYNAGMGRVPLRGWRSLPLATRVYVGRVFSAL